MLKRFSTFLVSTLCIRPTSTVKTGASNREGMVPRVCSIARAGCYWDDTTAMVMLATRSRSLLWERGVLSVFRELRRVNG